MPRLAECPITTIAIERGRLRSPVPVEQTILKEKVQYLSGQESIGF
jgi:hypothetical protein